MPSTLKKGGQILTDARMGRKSTNNQSGKEAQKAIIKKYGVVEMGENYYHRGDGDWQKYSIYKDGKRSGKHTNNPKRAHMSD